MTAVQAFSSDLVSLRAGRGNGGAPIFMFPGAGGDCAELSGLAAQIGSLRPLYGVKLAGSERDRVPGTVGEIADLAIAAIRSRQPNGPYQLAGFSFGGLVALEAARRLTGLGAEVTPPILIDCYFDARYWPAPLWLKAQARRISHHLSELKKRPAREALAELAMRTRRLAARFGARLGVRPPSASASVEAAASVSLVDAYLRVAEGYDPDSFPGRIYLLQARSSADFGVSPAELWRPRCPRLVVRETESEHRRLMHDPAALARLGAAFDRCLEPEARTSTPQVLLVTSMRWPATARLATSLMASGFRVTALCPSGHPLMTLAGVEIRRMPIVGQRRALREALAAAAPDLVVPCDERALTLVRGANEAPGRASAFARADVIARARAAGMRAPLMDKVTSAPDLRRWIAQHGLPAVLKTDGSWGGLGVIILHNERDAEKCYRRLASPPSTARAFKRALVNRNYFTLRAWLKRERSTVNAQRYVEGRDANIALSCWKGELLAAISVEVLETSCTHGPATVIRVIDNAEMLATARTLVSELALSGFCGMDFILDAEGRAHLLELNARATPTCHLSLGPGRNLATALRKCFGGTTVPTEPASATTSSIIALHPSALPEQIARWNAWHDTPDAKV